MKNKIKQAIKDAGFLGCAVDINDYGYIKVTYHDVGLNRHEAREAQIALETVTGLNFSWYVDVNDNKIRVQFRSINHLV